MKMAKAKYTAIGGQALIEGIMMKSPEKTALAVRKKDGSIDISSLDGKSLREKYRILRLPIIRGIIGFAESLIGGYKALMKSAEISGFADLEDEKKKKGETEEEKKETKEKESSGAFMAVIGVVASILGVAIAIVLFMAVPTYIVQGITYLFNGGKAFSPIVTSSIEQFIKLVIFVIYIWAVSLMNDIKRVYMYHGAEHKTIFCYEKGLPLTVENVREQRRFHPRCGTSFMILMILVSILISTATQLIFPGVYGVKWLWITVKILLIPLTCGVGFEVLRACGKYDNALTRIISAPGLWLQRITTKDPDDSMLEIAIAALKACEPKVPDVDRSVENENGEENGENSI